jgi:hypothetical protein
VITLALMLSLRLSAHSQVGVGSLDAGDQREKGAARQAS